MRANLRIIKSLLFFFILALTVQSFLNAESENPIAYSHLTGDYWQIWTMHTDGSGAKQITESPFDKRKPFWGPQNKTICYYSNNNELFSMDLVTGKEVQLLKEFGQIGEAAYAPDGMHLVFTRFDDTVVDTSNLWLLNLSTQEKRLLTTDPGLQYDPSFSPEGKKIVYVAGQGWGKHEIWLYDLEKNEKKKLTENESYDISPEFSPDGQQIAYSSNLMGNYDIWLMNADGSNQHKITKPLGLEQYPAWSPFGDKLAITSQRGGNLQIWLINLKGQDWYQMTKGDDESREPAWQR